MVNTRKLLGALAALSMAASALVASGTAVQAQAPKGDLQETVDELNNDRKAPPKPSGDFITAQAVSCFTDPTQDVLDLSTETLASYPRADIRAFCATHSGQQFGVSLQLVEPTNPTSDPNWDGLTGIIWDIDVNGDFTEDYYIVFIKGGAGAVSVYNGSTDQKVCSGTPQFDGSTYSANFPTSCIGGVSAFDVASSMVYDSNPNDPNAPVFFDTTDWAGPVVADSGPTPPPSGDRATGRLAGTDRYSTAVEISKNVFPSGAPVVFLARADAFADALAGSSLTARGPILLVPQCGSVPTVVLDEVRRLGAQEVVALGGGSAVCDSVLFEVSRA